MRIAKYAYTALDCQDPIALAEFYSKITGWPVEPLGDFKAEDVTWLELLDENGQIDSEKLDLVARLGGDWYTRVTKDSMFKLAKPKG